MHEQMLKLLYEIEKAELRYGAMCSRGETEFCGNIREKLVSMFDVWLDVADGMIEKMVLSDEEFLREVESVRGAAEDWKSRGD